MNLLFSVIPLRKALLIVAAILIYCRCYSGIEVFNTREASPTLPAMPFVMHVEDDQYSFMQANLSTWQQSFANKNVINRIIFSIDQASSKCQLQDFSVSVSLQITSYIFNTGTQTFQSSVTTKTLTIEHKNSLNYIDKSVYQFAGGNAMDVEVLSITPTPTIPLADMNISLEAEIEVERYYAFDPLYMPTGLSHRSDKIQPNGELEIFWDVIPGTEEYDLEWVHVNNYDGAGGIIPATNISIDNRIFQFNSTRISTINTFYRVPYIYNKGYILYRVRGVGKTSLNNYTDPIEGRWSSYPDSYTTVAAFTKKFPDATLTDPILNPAEVFIAHEDNLNWQLSVNYAEEGKSKAAVSYFDGSLRNRQSVSKSKTEDEVIVGETIYDHQGRGAIQVLPVPVKDNPKIEFNLEFNLNKNVPAVPYSRNDFDLDNSGNSCEATTYGMNTSSGASEYYSPNQNLTGEPTYQSYTPDAQDYPFTQVEYTPDNTGRIRAQSGVGADHKLGSEKETRYYYGQPEQEELDRLFGSEAGNVLHYKKNMVKDANSQLSISYLDPQGRVVATALTGAAPDKVVSLDHPLTQMNVDLLNKVAPTDKTGSKNELNLTEGTLTVSKEFLVASQAVREFKYEMQGNKYEESCSVTLNWPAGSTHTPNPQTITDNICYDCVLDLKISLTDECGVEYLPGVGTNAAGNPSAPLIIGQNIIDEINANANFNPDNCTSTEPSFDSEIDIANPWKTNIGGIPAQLKPGNYSLNKVLTVNQQALDFYTNDYLKNNNCLLSYDYFQEKSVATIDFSGCDMTCDQCTTLLGAYTKYSTTGCDPCLTQEEYDDLLAKCFENCDDKSIKCDAAFQTMLGDMSPMGQYGQVMTGGAVIGGIPTIPQSSTINPLVFPLSVFNDINQLPYKAEYMNDYNATTQPKFGDWAPTWRFPYNPDNSDVNKQFTYLDENGNKAYVKITLVNGAYTPAVHPLHILKIETVDASQGLYKVAPQFLNNVEDFILSWDPAWALSLVRYHPEYCYYEFCECISASHTFDDKWLGYNTFADMQAEWGTGSQYLNPVTSGIDPYFTSANTCRLSAESTAMLAGMAHFATDPNTLDPISIWQVAYATVHCPNGNGAMGCTACTYPGSLGNNTDPLINDAEWNTFKALYISLKQKIQQKRATKYAIDNGCYNGCIGKEAFNPFKNNFYFSVFPDPVLWFGPPWNFYHFRSQFHNFEQPCNRERYWLYKDKQPRFPGISDLVQLDGFNAELCYNQNDFNVTDCPEQTAALVEESQNLAELALFEECGQCPNANHLQMFLNSLADNGPNGLLSDGELLSCYPATGDYPEFTSSLADALNFTSVSNVTWEYDNVQSIPNSLFVGGFLSGTETPCELKLKFPAGNTLYEFEDIIKICCLKYIDNPVAFALTPYKNFQLTITVELKPGDPDYDVNFPDRTRQIVLEGISCIEVGNCTFDPFCTPSDEAVQLQNIFNALLFEESSISPPITETFTSTADVALTANPFNAVLNPLKTELDLAVDPGTPDPNALWVWKTDNITGNQMTAHISATGQTGSCNFSFTIQTAGYSFYDIISFSNINRNQAGTMNDFVITALADNGTQKKYIELTGSCSCFNMGVCSVSLPDWYVMGNNNTTIIEGPQPCIEVSQTTEFVPNGDFEGLYTTDLLHICGPNADDCNGPPYNGDNIQCDIPDGDPIWLDLKFESDHKYRYCWGGPPDQNFNTFRIRTDECIESFYGFNIGDHTKGDGTSSGDRTGKFIMVDGIASNNNDLICTWIQEFQVDPNTEYRFGFWVTRLYNSSQFSSQTIVPRIDFGILEEVNNQCVLVSILKPENFGMYDNQPVVIDPNGGVKLSDFIGWKFVSARFNSGANTSVRLGLTSYAIGSNGNDFGIDDITFTKVNCQPAPGNSNPPVSPTDLMCNLPTFPPIDPIPNPCFTYGMDIAKENANAEYQAYIAAVKQKFQEEYIAECLDVYEEFFMKYEDTEGHFTLYYYDQAGNLVRTVPPEGVKKVNAIDLNDPESDTQTEVDANMAQVKIDRRDNTRTYFTKHSMPTTYKYNSLNQLVSQGMPDNENLDIWDPDLANNGIPSTYNVTNTAFSDLDNGVAFATDGQGVGHIYLTSDGGATWSEITSIGIMNLNDVKYTSSQTAYAVGENGTVLKTTDGGVNWTIMTPPSTGELFRLYFDNGSTLVAYERNGNAWQTTDGGSTWSSFANNLSSLLGTDNLNDISFDNATDGFAVSNNKKLYYTTDAGVNWQALTSISSIGLNKVFSVSGLRLSAGQDGTLLKSANGGSSWEEIPNNLNNELKDIYFASTLNGWVLDGSGNIQVTSDGGTQWDPVPTGPYEDIFFYNNTNGYAVSSTGAVIKYDGSTWSSLSTGPSATGINTIFILDQSGCGFMGGDAGVLYSTPDGGATWTAVSQAGLGTENIKELFFSVCTTGVALTESGKIYYTADGVNFSAGIGLTSTKVYTAIHFTSANNGFAVAEDGTVALTTDGGVNWTEAVASGPISPGTNKIKSVFVESNNYATAVGENGEIWTTTDITEALTQNWTSKSNTVIPPALSAVHKLNGTNGFISGEDGTIIKMVYSGGTWDGQVQVTATNSNLHDINMFSAAIGAAVGQGGTIVYTNDGTTWPLAQNNDPGTNTLKSVVFTNAANAFAVGDNCSAIQTADFGVTWTEMTMNTSSPADNFRALAKNSSGELIGVGDMGKIFGYINPNWAQRNLYILPQLNDAQMFDADNGIAVGADGDVFTTNNGGVSWDFQNTGISADINAIYIFPGSNFSTATAIAVGENGTVLTTGNGGSTWTSSTVGTSTLNDIYFSGQFGLIVGNGGTAYYSTNGGTSWTNTGQTATTQHLNDVHIVDNTFAYAVGASGTIVKITTEGTVWTAKKHFTNADWTTFLTGSAKALNGVYFKDYFTGYAIGDNGTVIKTSDGGNTWLLDNLNYPAPPPTANLNDLNSVDNNNFFISGTGGSLTYLYAVKDEYATLFYYDQLGRLVVSQNSKQYNKTPDHFSYSYTLYDDLGRIAEVGEINATEKIENQYVSGKLDNTLFSAWINNANASKTEVTRTSYDVTASVPGFTQEYLRNRVSKVSLDDDGDGSYEFATYYSYDIHGNVKSLLHHIPELAAMSQEYKRIDYDYDLVSGNVKKVLYQQGQPDQFIHRYEYDADNRITNAFTSKDGIIWDQDAKYFYYKHGPLARTELGNDKVQGTDYAYTMQGWIKGVNSNILNPRNDIGTDGELTSGNIHRNIARDAYGYSLGYYHNDYSAVDANKNLTANNFVASVSNAAYLLGAGPDLYNGNISHMVTAITDPFTGSILPQLTAYKYDQLNRISQMKAYRDITLASNEWGDGTTYDGSYETSMTYDANGNILTLNRNGHTGVNLNMDGLRYHYENKSEGYKRNTNKLRFVADNATFANNYQTDIDDQQSLYGFANENYAYDEIGNLIKDRSEKIANIEWTVYGKVKKVQRNPLAVGESGQTSMEFAYDGTGNRIRKTEHRKLGTEISTEHTYYIRDAQGNVMATYERNSGFVFHYFKLKEHMAYGSSRLAVANRDQTLWTQAGGLVVPSGTCVTRTLGEKQFELGNHLGNVLSTVSDRRECLDAVDNITGLPPADGSIDYYTADITSSNDYGVWGDPLPQRSFNSDVYKYGFNGMEKDDEVKGNGNSYDFGARIYDPRLGRWLSVDPLQAKYSDLSPYSFGANNPLYFIDFDGRILRDKNNKIIYTKHGQSFQQESRDGKQILNVQPVYVFTNDGKPVEVFMVTSVTDKKTQKDVSDVSFKNTYICHGYSLTEGAFLPNSEYAVSNTLILDKMGKNNTPPSKLKDMLNKDFTELKDGDIVVFIGKGKTFDAEGKATEQNDAATHTAVWSKSEGKFISKNGYQEIGLYSLDELKEIYGDDAGFFTPVEDKKLSASGKQGVLHNTTEFKSVKEVEKAIRADKKGEKVGKNN